MVTTDKLKRVESHEDELAKMEEDSKTYTVHNKQTQQHSALHRAVVLIAGQPKEIAGQPKEMVDSRTTAKCADIPPSVSLDQRISSASLGRHSSRFSPSRRL